MMPARVQPLIIDCWELLGSYIYIMILPIHHFLTSYLIVTPILLMTCFIQTKEQREIVDGLVALVPEDSHVVGITGSLFDSVYARMVIVSGVAFMVAFGHYLV